MYYVGFRCKTTDGDPVVHSFDSEDIAVRVYLFLLDYFGIRYDYDFFIDIFHSEGSHYSFAVEYGPERILDEIYISYGLMPESSFIVNSSNGVINKNI